MSNREQPTAAQRSGDAWIDLLDPGAAEVEEAVGFDLHPAAFRQLDEAPGRRRPTLQSHGPYLVGSLAIPVVEASEDRVFFQELALFATSERLVTVRKTPPDGVPFDVTGARHACRAGEGLGMVVYHLFDEVAERYLDLVDDLTLEIEELEDHVGTWSPAQVRDRIAALRHDLLNIRQTLGPTRDAVRQVVDNRVELEGEGEVFSRDVELSFGDAYDKLLRAAEGLDLCRDLLAGVRDYHQAKIGNDQSEVMRRLTAVASLLLLPTLLVGLFGQNLDHIPGKSWGHSFELSIGLIIGITLAQLAFFKWRKWW